MRNLFTFDEDATLDSTHEGGICTNRSASGPITLTLPDTPAAGTQHEVHGVAAYDLHVEPSNSTGTVAGAGSVILRAGDALAVTYTAPNTWTGLLSRG